jgi:hypothetical protein
MTDPRNIAHDEKVLHEKKHDHEELAPGLDERVQPGKKPHLHHEERSAANDEDDKTDLAGNA